MVFHTPNPPAHSVIRKYKDQILLYNIRQIVSEPSVVCSLRPKVWHFNSSSLILLTPAFLCFRSEDRFSTTAPLSSLDWSVCQPLPPVYSYTHLLISHAQPAFIWAWNIHIGEIYGLCPNWCFTSWSQEIYSSWHGQIDVNSCQDNTGNLTAQQPPSSKMIVESIQWAHSYCTFPAVHPVLYNISFQILNCWLHGFIFTSNYFQTFIFLLG